jgi:hypothetical protein
VDQARCRLYRHRPVTGLADAGDYAGDIGQKPGMVALAPGEVWKASISLTHERAV